ncbi:hypothetical protein Dimus_032612 [Dionaea muscipula]
MAKCSIVQSDFKLLHCQQNGVRATQLKPQNSFAKFVGRNSKAASLSFLNIRNRKIKTRFLSSDYIASSLRKSSFNCNYSGTLIDSESVAASDWIAVTDQVLLMASVFLTYMAGIIPSGKSFADSQRSSTQERLPPGPTILGSLENDGERIRPKCVWDTVREKLGDSLKVIEQDNIVESKGTGIGKYKPLSLFAISDGSQIQLVLSSLEQLEREVGKLADSSIVVERVEWLTTFGTMIQKASQSACISWMEKELIMKNCMLDRAVLCTMSEKLNGDDSILQNVRRLGKLDLYADLLYFLRFDSLRCGHFDNSLFDLHGVVILEDLVITLADGIASIYLECISVDSNISDKMPNLAFTLCSLSTRALQKLRNEVAMKQWFRENVESVISMYEDHFDLCTLQRQLDQEPIKNQSKIHSWLKKLSLRRSVIAQPPQQYFVVRNFSLTVKRTKELRALSGWKYYFSLVLELSDILMPLVNTVIVQVRNAISFFLVSLIGRSLGLIYTGIRQSLCWK